VREASTTATARNRTSLGLVLIIVGLILALDSAGVLRTEGLGRWWPLVLIGVGVVKVRQPREDGQRAAGVAFLMLGACSCSRASSPCARPGPSSWSGSARSSCGRVSRDRGGDA
jgi:hypothetical protein